MKEVFHSIYIEKSMSNLTESEHGRMLNAGMRLQPYTYTGISNSIMPWIGKFHRIKQKTFLITGSTWICLATPSQNLFGWKIQGICNLMEQAGQAIWPFFGIFWPEIKVLILALKAATFLPIFVNFRTQTQINLFTCSSFYPLVFICSTLAFHQISSSRGLISTAKTSLWSRDSLV